MGDKLKFYRMTKPIKRRKIKVIRRSFKDFMIGIADYIVYVYNLFMCKIGLYKRLTYKDTVDSVIPLPLDLDFKEITTPYFKGVLILRLLLRIEIDSDYFYKTNKQGKNKNTLILKDNRKEIIVASSHLEKLRMKVVNWNYVDELPTFKMAEPEKFYAFQDEPLKEVRHKIITYDIAKLKALKHEMIIGGGDVEIEDIKYCYELAVKEFTNMLKTIKPSDLML